MKLEPIEVTERLYVRVAKRIAQLIERGEVEPGQKLPSERDLADMLKVSRPTIREAMIALEVAGVIEVRTGSGIYVKEGQEGSLNLVKSEGIGPFDIFELRLMVEPEAAALAATRMTDAQLDQLRDLMQQMREQAQSASLEDIDQQFHIHIARSTENAAIVGTVEWLWRLRGQSEMSAGFHRTILDEGVFPVIDEHDAVVEAITSRNPEAARQAMRDHLEAATQAAAQHFATS